MIIQDIVMCSAIDCERKAECFRKTARPKEFMQKYHDYSKQCNLKCGFCAFLEKIENRENSRSKNP